MDFRPVDSLQYVLIPGKPGLYGVGKDLHDKAFVFWKSFWESVLREIGAENAELHSDDFLRHEIIALLMHHDEVVAQHAYCFFDLDLSATPTHSFIAKYFDETLRARLAAKKLRHVMSLEFLAVSPEWRSSKAGLSLAAVVIALGCRVGLAAGLDGMIAAARADVPVAKLGYQMGALPIRQGILVHGKPTDMLFWDRQSVKGLEDLRMRDLTEKLWASRIDNVGLTTTSRLAAA